MKIEHGEFFGGQVQSLKILKGDQVTMSTGIVLPGSHNFGEVEKRETIRVVHGSIEINGKLFRAGEDPCVIEPGENVVLVVREGYAIYVCAFG
jgi:uncharacterized protein YaiE (UPF0345 family)